MNYTAELVEMLADELYYRQMLHNAGKKKELHPYYGEDGMSELIKEFEHLVMGEGVKIPQHVSAYHDVARRERAKYNQAKANKRYYEKNKAKDA